MAQNDMTSDPWDDLVDGGSVEADTSGPVGDSDAAQIPPSPPPVPMSDPSHHAASPDAGDQAPSETVPAAPDAAEAEIDLPTPADAHSEAGAMHEPSDFDVPADDVTDHGVDIPDLPTEDDARDVDFADALEIPDLDLAGVGIGGTDVDIPDVPAVEIDDFATPDFDVSDLVESDADEEVASDVDIAELEDTLSAFSEGTDHPATRTPFSPMFAATGIFGDGPASEDETHSEDPADFGASTPPAVYAELEALSGDDNESDDDGVDVVAEAIGAADEDAGSMDDLAFDAALTTERDEAPSEIAEPEQDGDTLAAESVEVEAVGEVADDEGEITEDSSDDDFEALAALVADVDPIVMGDDEGETVVPPIPTDTDDWLADEAQDGFDIGITLGTDDAALAEELDVEPLDEQWADGGEALAEAGIESEEIPVEPSVPADIFASDLDAFTQTDIEAIDESTPTASDQVVADTEAPVADTGAPVVDTGAPVVGIFDDLQTSADTPSPGSAEPAGSEVTEGWGARWKESAQGWVEDEAGTSIWRPIVTTSSTLSEWEVDTYLGIVIGDGAAIASAEAVAEGRATSTQRMMDEALARGAHAVIGVSYTVQPLGAEVLVTATGTAVTLKADAPN